METHFDDEELRQRLGGDRKLFADTLRMFLAAPSHRADEMREAAVSGDAGRLTKLAHSLRGVALTISAPRLAELAAALEERARAGEIGDAAERIGQIEEEYVIVRQAVSFMTDPR